MKNLKILVIGASGFIGSSICKYLKFRGYSVIGTSRQQCHSLQKELGIKIISFDYLADKLDTITFDVIIHCGTPNDILSKNDILGLRSSVEGTWNILNSMVEANTNKLIFFSTLQVYGSNLEGSYCENSEINATNSYALNHYLGEQVCSYFSKNYNIDTCIIRPSNVFGLAMASSVDRFSLVPFCFINELSEKKSISIRSSGLQSRNFVSLLEINLTIDKILSEFPPKYTIINCTSYLYLTIKEVAKITVKQFSLVRQKAAPIIIKSKFPKITNVFNTSPSNHCPKLSKSQTKKLLTSTIKSAIIKLNKF